MNIEDMQDKAHGLATSKGWWPELGFDDAPPLSPENIGSKLALIHSEVSEALECVRDGDMDPRVAESGKPEGLPSELADVLIRVADLAGALGIDLQAAVVEKMAFNATRAHRHGGRAL